MNKKKITGFRIVISILLLIAGKLSAQFAEQPPFKISIEPVYNTTINQGFHSFAFAQSGSKWLLIGGRTNGLHGLNSNDPFPQADANNFITVIDTVGWQIFQSSLSNLPYAVADPLRSTNMQYVQKEEYLYMIGGYGRDSILNKFVTFPVVSRLLVDSVIEAVINQTPVDSFIKQVTDTNLRICGGEMHYYTKKFQLMFGHDFNGRYANPFVPIYTQYYRSQIKRFEIFENAGNIEVVDYTELTDTNNFHRRDLNVVPMIQPNGDHALMAHAGVFQKQRDFPYFEPIYMDTSGYTVLPYTQVLNHYTCAYLPIFDTVSKKMHTVFFGGMSFNDFVPTSNSIVEDTLVPFISDVTCFTVKPGNICEEAVMPVQLPGLLGTNAKFIPNRNISWYVNDVMDFNSITGKTLAGYILGGIRADLPNEGSSVANDTIYRIYIEYDSTVSIKTIGEEFAFFDVFPNPATNKLSIQFQLKEESEIQIGMIDVNGKVISGFTKMKYSKGKVQKSIDVSEVPNGIYVIKCNSKKTSINRKVIVMH
ncbi:MAG: T9SS type A sorting domain-containing protein [Bacteroidota bacterium]|nr:T9SS type A sorting domain-containing protein [Bacteroidota bacterium]